MILGRFLRRHLDLVLQDIAEQYALPIRSLTGFIVSHMNNKKTRPIKSAAIEALDIQPNDNILEIGYRRGDGLGMVLNAVKNGSGRVFGIEHSRYLEEVVRKRFILEIEEDKILQLERVLDLSTLPYPNDFFNGIFHVDSFYFWGRDLHYVCHDLLRVLAPGGIMICGMQLNRLRKLEKWGILRECQYNPVRYLSALEPAGFRNIKMIYVKRSDGIEIQLIKAEKPEASSDYYDPDARMMKLEADIKHELMIRRMLKEGKPVYDLQEESRF